MGRFLFRIMDFFTDISGKTASIVVVAGMIAAIWAIVWTWAKNLDKIQIGLFAFTTLCLFIFFLYLFGKWWRKHSLERLPDLIDRLDSITMDYIDNTEFKIGVDEWKSLLGQYGSLIGMDFHRLISATATTKIDMSVTEEELSRFQKVYDRKSNTDPKNKFASSINDLRDIGELLNNYNIGLIKLKETKGYQRLMADIKILQRQLPTLAISIKVNDYLYQSEGYYSMLLSTKPIMEMSFNSSTSQMLIKASVKKGQMRPSVEGQITNLIASIRESIATYKERNTRSIDKK
jgi:hypothetical protein